MAKYEEEIKNDELFKNAQKVERIGLEIQVISEEGYIFYVTGDSVEFAGLTGDELPDIDITIAAGESVNKKVTLTINVENNINRNIKYTIYRDDIEVGQVMSKEDSFTYDMDTVFGISKVYVKSLNENDEEKKSNEINVEDLCIASLDEIKKFRDSVNNGNNYDGKTIQQIANIDMQGSSSNLWIPIGTEENQFLGVYDGKGNSISNLYIDFDGKATGFFGYSGGTIKNVGVESGLVKGKNLTAGLLGHNEQGKVENCYNIGETIIEGTDTELRNGGIAGTVTVDSGATIKNSYWLSSASPTGAGDTDITTLELYEKNESQMKNIASSLGSAFKNDTNNINNGYPILSWQ